jgi:hypothetical protein
MYDIPFCFFSLGVFQYGCHLSQIYILRLYYRIVFEFEQRFPFSLPNVSTKAIAQVTQKPFGNILILCLHIEPLFTGITIVIQMTLADDIFRRVLPSL